METANHPDHLALLLDASDELLMLVAPEGLKVLAVNRRLCEELGYTAEQLTGQPVSDIECALADLFFWEEMLETAAGEEKVAESSLRRADGSVLDVIKTVRRVAAPDNAVEHFTVCAVPIGRQQQIENDLAHMGSRLRATLEATADGILLVDREGHILNMNRRFSDMWRLTPDLLLDRNDALIFNRMAGQLERPAGAPPPDAQEARSDVLEERFDLLRLADGRVFERDTGIAWEHEQIIGRVFSYRDVTERHRTQQELLHANEEVRRASRAKGDFLAMMSHEIRTPLNAIIGINELMLDGTLDPAQRDYAKSIASSAEALLVIINDILDFSKIEAGRLEIEHIPFDLRGLLDDIVRLHAFRASDKGLHFHFNVAADVPAGIVGDPTRLRQIIGNCLSNALKFTDSGEVAFSVERSAGPAGPQLRIAIRATGIGMSAEAQSKLFSPFTQADSTTTRRFGGTGLGLAITRQLVELLHGEIRVDSVEGRGSTFTVLLPLTEAAAYQRAAPAPAAPSAAEITARQAARILLVEDNPTNQVVALGMLRKLGYTEIRTAANGQEALDAVAGQRFDVILMDCQMPVMDGYTATGRLRAGGCATPIVAMTANAMQGDREKCLDAGMNDFLPKPLRRQDFAAALARWTALPASTAANDTTDAAPEIDTAAPAAPATFATFARATALALYDGDSKLLDLVINAFVADTPITLAKLHAALQAGNAVEARIHVHGIKGAAASAGAEALCATARDMELAARDGQIERAMQLLPTLERQFGEFRTALADGA